MTDDDVLIVEEDAGATPIGVAAAGSRRPWKVAVIDDDASVHDGTRFALFGYELNGSGLEILSAYSAEEGRRLLEQHADVAVILLDVVMETDSAGLDLVGAIRREMNNEAVRIILRTGQPGQAPERDVIIDYDINDYKAKTELTATKLFTAVTAALRGYQQLERMIETRRGLEIIVDATDTLYNTHSIQRLAEGVLTQITWLLDVQCAGILALRRQSTAEPAAGQGAPTAVTILAGSGCYGTLVDPGGYGRLAPDVVDALNAVFSTRSPAFPPGRTLLYIGGGDTEVVVLLETGKPLSETSRTLIEVFCSRIAAALENVALYEQLQEINRSLEERVAARTGELATANVRLLDEWQRARKVQLLQGDVLGTVAHDLKNPLSVIMGRTEILRELIDRSGVADGASVKQIEAIRTSTARLITMTDELVATATADAHDIAVRPTPGDLAAIVGEVVEANRLLAARKQQQIAFDAVSAHAAVFDQGRMRDAVDNLISNAVKYSPLGSPIDVTLSADTHGVAIAVRDRGPGLLPEDRERLFGRFQRLSAKPTGGETSTGLGLSIAKRIVDLHGGTLLAESAGAGLGTTFTIRLPVASAPERP